VWTHLKKHPAAHIYHYGHYEETALKHLMSEHCTKEFQVDQLLRNHKLVDLYKVVKQGLRISESSYSLKKIENYYMEKRDAEVVSAVESGIFYGKWKLTRDPAILDSIRNYNEDDCRSTSLLHTWLLSIKPASAACFFEPPAESVLDFLLSRKRLNVALSRARCLAVLIANPRLLETKCNTVEQMGLINTLCRAYYAGVTN
jgi:hypothetical protein